MIVSPPTPKAIIQVSFLLPGGAVTVTEGASLAVGTGNILIQSPDVKVAECAEDGIIGLKSIKDNAR